MEKRVLGKSGLQVTPICLGGNVFGWTANEAASFSILDTFVEGGGNFLDTADIYMRRIPGNKGGESETIIGKWLKSRNKRDEVIIATKVGGETGPSPEDKGLSQVHIIKAVEDSLQRLQIERIDLFQAHFDDPDTPLEETLKAFDQLLKQGKVRYIGASNYSAERLKQALDISEQQGLAQFISLQPRYNLLDREEYEKDLEPLCLERDLGVITYFSLASGFLTGKYRPDKPLPTSGRAAGIQKTYMNERGFTVLNEVDRIAEKYRATPTQVALAWVMARPGITSAIASATNAEQAKQLLKASVLHLDQEDITALNQVSEWRAEVVH